MKGELLVCWFIFMCNSSTIYHWYSFLKEILEDDPHVEASRVLQILNEEVIPDQPALSVLGSK